MNRRSFFKFLGICAAAAVVAPKFLANPKPEFYPESNGGEITLKMLQDAYAKTVPFQSKMQGRYIYVKLPKSTLPFRAGDIVWWKKNKKGETIAFRDKKGMTGHKEDEFYAMAIGDLTPGNYGFIQIMERRW